MSHIGIGQDRLTLKPLAKKHHICPEWARHLYNEAIKKLRTNNEIDEYRIYVTNEINEGKKK